MKNWIRNMALLTVSGCATPALSGVISIDPNFDFDIATDFTDNFTNNGGTSYAHSASAGVAGSGGLTTVVSDGAATFQSNATTQFETDTQSVSAMFLFDDGGQSQATTSVRAGVGTVNGGGNSGEFRGINFQIRNGGGANDFTARLRVRGNTVATTESGIVLTDGHWYRLDAAFALAADGNSFTYDFSVYDMGTAGTSVEGTVFELNDVVVDSSGFAFDPSNTRHLAFIGTTDGNGYGFTEIDEVGTVLVPEPATASLIAVGGVLMLSRKRRG